MDLLFQKIQVDKVPVYVGVEQGIVGNFYASEVFVCVGLAGFFAKAVVK